MSRPTISLAVLREAGVRIPPLEGWLTLAEVAALLGLSYQGAVYLVLDQQIVDLARDVRVVGDRTVIVRREALDVVHRNRSKIG